jgi:small subunit ribosomal protein S1
MPAEYDAEGNYKYPEGFDSETGDWLEGFDQQRETWERQYAEARTRFDAHKKQVEEARKAEAEAAAPQSYNTGEEQQGAESGGALASDEALAALREKLSGGQE